MDDKRQGRSVVRGAFKGLEDNTTSLVRFNRAPEQCPDQDDVDLPEWAWAGPKRKVEPSREVRLAVAKDAIRRAFEIEHKTLADTLPQRVRVAWRITRELARIMGLVSEEETLTEGLVTQADGMDPWTHPAFLKYPLPGRPNRNALALEVITLLEEATTLGDLHSSAQFPMAKEEELARRGSGGLALVPPEVPYRWRDPDTLAVVSSYEEYHDPLLQGWCRVLEAVGRTLHIGRGTETSPELGRLGMAWLIDPETARLAWPSRMQILYWEEVMTQMTLDFLVSKGITKTRRNFLQEEHGLTHGEATTMIKLAMALSRDQVGMDVEEQRALMILRLEDYVARSQKALELNFELRGLKQLAIVQGLGKTDPEDVMTAFANMAQRFDVIDAQPVAQKQPKRLT